MRIVPLPKSDKPQFQIQELLFLDCWHCLSHEKSLDSYRVKCLNARTIAQELRDEIELDILDEPEFASLTADASEVLARDVVIGKHYSREVAKLAALMQSATGKSTEKDKSEVKAKRQPLYYAVADLAATLERNYFSLLILELRIAIKSGGLSAIPLIVNALLSDLLAIGWQLSNLWTWHETFLNDKSFDENLEFLLTSISKPPSMYKVALRITGGTSVRSIQQYGSLALSTEASIQPKQDHEKTFAKANRFTVFAVGSYNSVDFRSAAISARDELDPLIDALRFEYEPRTLSVDRNALVERVSDGRTMLVSLPNSVPNPVTPVGRDDFDKFASQLSEVLSSKLLDGESLNKIKIAFRRFRTGRDSYKYSDKFLYWWMGLEALTNSSNKRIGRTVTRNTSHAMLVGYLPRIVNDFRITLKSLHLEWKQEYESIVKLGTWKDLSNHGLVQMLRDPTTSSTLFQEISNRSFVLDRGRLLQEWLTKPKALSDQLRTHKLRLHWHLDRLYRIRCCLVHGAPIRFKLALFAANLEYYLKQTLSFTLDSFYSHPHVRNLDGLFVRTVAAWDNLIAELDGNQAGLSEIDRVLEFSVFPRDCF